MIGKHPAGRTGSDKTSAVFAVRHKVGALHEVLGLFARNAVNVSKIESRPMRSRACDLFFVDLSGHREDPKLKRALKALERQDAFSEGAGIVS